MKYVNLQGEIFYDLSHRYPLLKSEEQISVGNNGYVFPWSVSTVTISAISVARCYNDESELRSFKRNGRLLANDIGYSKKKKMQVLPAGVEPPLTYMKLL